MSSAIVPTSRKYYSRFDPSKLTDCNFWLDASNTSSITLNGSNVSQWNDLSGNGYNATQATSASQPTVSGNFVVFSSNRFLTVPGGAFNNLKNWSLYMVINPISSTNWILTKPNSTVDTYNYISMTNYPGSSNVNTVGTTGYCYAGVSITNGSYSTLSALTTSTVQLVEFHFDDINLIISVNGNVKYTNVLPTELSTTNSSSYTSALGVWNRGGVIQNSGVTNFQLGELLIFANSVTPSDRIMISKYLMNKWGIKTDIELFYRHFSPTDIPNCSLWVDASDLSTLYQDTAKTQPVTTNGQNVRAVVDKANGNTFTRGTTTYPTIAFNSLNKLSGITYNLNPHTNSSLIGIPISNSTSIDQGLTCFCVFKSTRTTTSVTDTVYQTQNNATNVIAGFYVASSSTTPVLRQSVTNYSVTATTNISNVNVLCSCKYLSSTNLGDKTYYYYLGTLYNTVTSAVAQVTGYIGTTTLGSFIGVLYEVLIYNRYLFDSEQEKIEAYLSRKWGITLTTSTNLVKYNPYTPKFNIVNNLLACSFWADASDPNGTGVLPADGTSISTWREKSYSISEVDYTGNNTFKQTTAANQPIFTYDGSYPAIYFSGSPKSMVVTSSTVLSSKNQICLFLVCRPTSVSGTQVALRHSRSGLTSYYEVRTSTSGLMSTYYNGTSYYSEASYTGSTTAKIYVIRDIGNGNSVYNNANNMFYINGTNIATSGAFFGTEVTNSTSDSTIYIGYNGSTNYFTGYIYEYIAFKRYVNDIERQLIEGYLAWKWGIQGSLPSTHPFAKYPPS